MVKKLCSCTKKPNESMNLRDWISNSKFVNQNTSPNDQMIERVIKVLGLIWNTNTDQQKNLRTLNKQKQNMKF